MTNSQRDTQKNTIDKSKQNLKKKKVQVTHKEKEKEITERTNITKIFENKNN